MVEANKHKQHSADWKFIRKLYRAFPHFRISIFNMTIVRRGTDVMREQQPLYARACAQSTYL